MEALSEDVFSTEVLSGSCVILLRALGAVTEQTFTIKSIIDTNQLSFHFTNFCQAAFCFIILDNLL